MIAHAIEFAQNLLDRGLMLRGWQIRLGRIALGWSQQQLADSAKLGVATIARAESAEIPPITAANLFAVQRSLESGGIIFIEEAETSFSGGPGLRLRRPIPKLGSE